MPQTIEFDLKQTVLQNDTFGPREVRQMQEAIARDFSQYAVLRDAVGELQSREEQTPASHVRLGVCFYLLGRYYRAIEILRQGRRRRDDALLPGEVPLRPAGVPRGACGSYKAAEKAGYDAGDCVLGAGRSAALCQRCGRRCEMLDSLSGAIEQTAEYLAQRAATVAALGGNPKKWSRCTSGRSRSIAIIPARCSAWPWRTTATATTTRRWNCTSGRSAAFPPTSARW